MTPPKLIDLRSDTVTRPTQAMRQAMAEAIVGDDVIGDDPTVKQLEKHVAQLFKKEAALFVPSGTMANTIAIRCHTKPGDEIICHQHSHCYQYETGAPAAINGLSFALLTGDRGQFQPNDVTQAIRHDDEHFPNTAALVLENTMNKAGGTVWPIEQFAAVANEARNNNLRVHLDGARIWNAAAATNTPLHEYAQHVDTISCCFSKGLGAPLGSAIVADQQTIRAARRYRKMLGGAMRQVGIVAAGALHAIDHHRQRLTDDHANAKLLAQLLDEHTALDIDISRIETNMVFFTGLIAGKPVDATTFCKRMLADDARVGFVEMDHHVVRAVAHLDITTEDIHNAVKRITPIINN